MHSVHKVLSDHGRIIIFAIACVAMALFTVWSDMSIAGLRGHQKSCKLLNKTSTEQTVSVAMSKTLHLELSGKLSIIAHKLLKLNVIDT